MPEEQARSGPLRETIVSSELPGSKESLREKTAKSGESAGNAEMNEEWRRFYDAVKQITESMRH